MGNVFLEENCSNKKSEKDCLDNFIPSDWDILKEKEARGEEENKFEITPLQPRNNDEEQARKASSCSDQSEENKKTCLILEFSLPSSSYATMALRELLVEDLGTGRSSSDNQVEDKESQDKEGLEEESSEPASKMAKLE